MARQNNFTTLKECLVATHIGGDEGKGCVFTQPLTPDNDRIVDIPLYSYIHEFSRKTCITCANCYRPVGSVIDNLNHVLKLGHKELSNHASQLLASHGTALDCSNFMGCDQCAAVFCSTECMEASGPIHALLCEKMTTQERADWSAFHRYCIKTNENFYFVGLIYATTVAQVVYHRSSLPQLVNNLSEYYEVPWHLLPPSSDGGAQSESARLTRASEAFKLLSKSLDRHVKLMRRFESHHADRFCSLDYYLRLLSKVTLVAVEIEIVNPLNKQIRELLQDQPVRCAIGEELAAVKRILYGLDSTCPEVSDWDIELPDLLGVGIYESLSRLNNSCSPNLEFEYGCDNLARVRVLRPVSAGEQATIAYIDEQAPLEERRKELWNVSSLQLSF